MADLAAKLALIVFIVSITVILVYMAKYLLLLFKSIKQGICNTHEDSTYQHLDSVIKAAAISALNKDEDGKIHSSDLLQSDREEAQVNILDNVKNIMNPEKLKEVGSYIGDVDEWISGRIEYHIRSSK